MAELFKENLSLVKIVHLTELVHSSLLASKFSHHASDFEGAVIKRAVIEETFIEEVLIEEALAEDESNWESLSLMQRLRAAARALLRLFPQSESGGNSGEVVKSMLIVFQQNKELSGWLSLVCCEYVGINSELTFEQGMKYLKQLTSYFSAEFAIRHFIIKDPEKALSILTTWLEDEDQHVRRLISEGTRPRLPWGVRLPGFIEKPELVMPLLTALRDDEEEYVRRSVANHLNDIAKDHPQLVIKTAREWLSDKSLKSLSVQQKKYRHKLIRHACRTLFKQGNPAALSLFGYGSVDKIYCCIELEADKITWESDLNFSVDIMGDNVEGNKYMIDYIIHYQKSNGRLAPKVFKWLDRTQVLTNGNGFKKVHSFKAITTRKHYAGLHKIEVVINGVKMAEAEFELLAQT